MQSRTGSCRSKSLNVLDKAAIVMNGHDAFDEMMFPVGGGLLLSESCRLRS